MCGRPLGLQFQRAAAEAGPVFLVSLYDASAESILAQPREAVAREARRPALRALDAIDGSSAGLHRLCCAACQLSSEQCS